MSNTIKDAKIHRNELISLAPTYEAKDTTEIYKKYIDEILNEKEHQRSKKYKNKNIAISGGYGAGKSSILNTYFKNEETGQMLQDKVLFVSLGSYIENNDNKLDGKEQKAVEVSILQQIIYSVAPEDIPFSRISRIDHDRIKLIVWTVVIALLLIPLITYKLDFYSGDNTCSENILTLVGLGIFFSIWWGLYYILNKYNINVIHLGSSNAKAEANQNELSLLNKYIDELVYFFKTTNKEIIVFEDIDRLEECQKVFSKLKEINSIINTSIKSKTVRFIYCIGEDIFENAEKKTKFFDIIIPIIPYIGTSTSREILAKELNEKQNEDIPNSDLITIGRFISNPRIAFEIINEYKIFKNNMNDNDMKIQLLYLISYKVLFPKEFEYLQRNEGTLAYTLSPEFEKEFLEYLHTQRKAASERELKRLENKLSLKIKPYVESFISYLVENFDITNFSEAIFMDEKTNKITSLKEISDDYLKIFEIEPSDLVLRVDDENIPEEKIFANESKIDFFKKIENYNIQSNILEIKQSIENENDSFINLDDYTHEKEEYIKAIEMLPSHLFYPKNMILNENEKTNNKMITLNRFEEILIERKYINANTKKLIVRRHNEIISKNDDNIITKIIDNQNLPMDTKIEKPRQVISELGVIYFGNDSTAIPSLYLEILSQNFDDSAQFINAIANKWSLKKFEALRYVGEKNNINVLKPFEKYIDKIWEELEQLDVEENSDLINYYIYQTIICDLANKLKEDSIFYYTLETKENIVEYLEGKYVTIRDKLNKLNIRFEENVILNEQCPNMIKIIYNNEMFSKCINHLEEISKVMNFKFDKSKIIESITSNQEKIINTMLVKDIDNTLKWINSLGIEQHNSEESIIIFANKNNLSEEQLIELMHNNKKGFDDITELDSKYYHTLIESDKLNVTIPNLISMYKDKGKIIDEELAQFIIKNRNNISNLDFSGDSMQDFCISFTESNLFDNDVFENLCQTITRGKNYSNIEEMPINNLKVLVKQGKILIKEKEKFERIMNNEEMSLMEKSKVLIDNISKLKDISIQNIDSTVIKEVLLSDVSAKDKVDFISNNPEYLDIEIKDVMFDIMLATKINIKPEFILNILSADKTDNQKIEMYLNYEEELNEISIDDILRYMGGIFIKIANKENNIFLDNNSNNEEFIDKLINKYEIVEKQDKKVNKIRLIFGEKRKREYKK